MFAGLLDFPEIAFGKHHPLPHRLAITEVIEPLKSIWLSDLHFSAVDNVLGHNPRARLTAAVEFINRHHSDAGFCIISGDLVNRGSKSDYQQLKHHLDKLHPPCFVMAGNHDNRELLRACFTLPECSMSDFIQYGIDTPAGLMLCLDTQKTGHDSGEICGKRLEWLHAQLQQAGDTPVYLFMHHPPMNLGLPMQDTENLDNGDDLLALIRPFANIKHLFIGHVHRPICGSIDHLPFTTMRSVLYQAPAPIPDWDWDSFAPAREAPQLGIVTFEAQQTTVHFTQFCDYRVGT